jgi:glycosyltransferase involved in cell wall biosynthesis
MNQIKVSIIIVSLNADKTIDNAIKSILNQTYKNIELVIFDAKSSDNTIDIIKKYAILDNRIWYVSEPDKGIYDAMNKGWKKAGGEWVLYLGADDELLPNAIEVLVKNKKINADIVYGDVILKYPNGNLKLQKAKDADYLPLVNCCCHQSMIMKKTCLESLNGFNLEYKILADYDLLVRAYRKKNIFQQIDETISCFRIGGASHSYKTFNEIIQIRKSNDLPLRLVQAFYNFLKSRYGYVLSPFITPFKIKQHSEIKR